MKKILKKQIGIIALAFALQGTLFTGLCSAGQTEETDSPLKLVFIEQETAAVEEPEMKEENGNITGSEKSREIKSAKDAEPGMVLTEKDVEKLGVENFFYVEEISDELFQRMWGKSYKEYCTYPVENLRYIRLLHKDIDGNIKVGELVMNVVIADTVCSIFRQLYDASYPFESVLLVDDFGADDETSIMHNNTSAFNYRTVDNTSQISNHAYGLAIDINPYYNVYYIASEGYIFPEDGWQYLDRESDFPYKLAVGDLCYNLFTEAGFEWGGWWTYNTDYQHFQYPYY